MNDQIEWANTLKLFLSSVAAQYKILNGSDPQRLLPKYLPHDCVEILCCTHDWRETTLTVTKLQIVDATDSFAADCAFHLSQWTLLEG